jgi:hypothetical protein
LSPSFTASMLGRAFAGAGCTKPAIGVTDLEDGPMDREFVEFDFLPCKYGFMVSRKGLG